MTSATGFRLTACCACGTPTPQITLLPFCAGTGNYPICPGCYMKQVNLYACATCAVVYPALAFFEDEAGTRVCVSCLSREQRRLGWFRQTVRRESEVRR
jgi:hypothetical protein